MGDPKIEPLAEGVESSASDRLESWKEIAAYLKRDVRTVQRWEKREGLPVSRHIHDKLGTVYADRREIDAWWASRSVRLETDQATGEDASDTNGNSLSVAVAESTSVVQPPVPGPEEVALPAFRPPHSYWWKGAWLGAFAACVAVGLVGLSLWRRSGAPSTGHPTLRQVASLDRPAARVSPDGRWLTYQDASQHLYLKNVASGETRALVAEYTYFPFAWSRDGRKLAFLTSPDRYGRLFVHLEVIDVESRERQTVWQGAPGAMMEPHDWTPDGKQILCRVRLPDGSYQIALVSVETRSVTALASAASMPRSLQLSPDSRFVSYSLTRNNNRDLYLLPLAGERKEVRLTDHPARDSMAFWCPDGHHLVYWRQRGATARLWALPIDLEKGTPAGAPALLTGPGPRSIPISITADGTLYFSRRKRASQVFVFDVDPVTGEPAGAPKPAVEDDTYDPFWSPDGRRLFFRRQSPAGDSLLAARNLASGDEWQMRPPLSFDVVFFARTHSSNSFTFYGWSESRQRAFYEYRPAVEQTQVLLAVQQEEPIGPASWSPGGQELVFAAERGRDGRYPVRVFRRSDASVRTVAFSGGRPSPQWSPDGSEIAYSDKSCLMVVKAAGGTARQVACGSPSIAPRYVYNSLGGVSWSPKGDKLAWIFHNEPQRRVEMHIVDYKTGDHTAWNGETDYASWPSDPAWAPDGRQIAVRMDFRPEYEVWALSEFLPASEKKR